MDEAIKDQGKAAKASDSTLSKVRLFIESNHYSPGDALPPERELAARFNVSRHTLREALRVMEERGILVSKRGSGTFIADFSAAGLRQALANCVSGEVAQLVEIFQFREILEPQVAALAARMSTRSDIEQLDALIAQQVATVDPGQLMEIDVSFHAVIARATGNALLCDLVEKINHALNLARAAHLIDKGRQAISIAGHRAILAAIRNGNEDEARVAMETHIQEIRGAVFALL